MRWGILVLCLSLLSSNGWAKKDKNHEAEEKKAAEEVLEKEAGQKRDQTTFGISPPVIDLKCTPGQRITTSIKIENPASVASRFKMEPLGLIVDKGGFSYKPLAALPPDHLSRHVSVESPEIKIPANTTKNVTIFVDVPATLKGTHYAGFNVSNSSPGVDPASQKEEAYKVNVGFGLQPAIAVTIKCHVEGTEKSSYALKKIEIIRSSGNQPPSAVAEIQNTGNAEIKLNSLLILLDSEKKVVTRMKMLRAEYLLPGATAKISFQPSFKEVPNGSYKAIISSVDPETRLPPLEQIVVVGK